MGKRHIFAEKEAGLFVFRRCFRIAPDEKFIVPEDVVTGGDRIRQTIDIVRQRGGQIAGVGVIVDRRRRSASELRLPLRELIEMKVETLTPNQLPPDLFGIPAVKPANR